MCVCVCVCVCVQEAGSLAGSVQSVEIDTPYGPLHVTVQVFCHASLQLFKFITVVSNSLKYGKSHILYRYLTAWHVTSLY